MKNIDKCPFCSNGLIEYKKINIRGKSTNVFSCSNASWYSEDGELFELSKDSTCSFRIWGNSLQKWGKKQITLKEVKALLRGDDVIVNLWSFKAKKKYKKYLTLSKDYGVSVVWDIDIDD